MPESHESVEHLLVGLVFNCLDDAERLRALALVAADPSLARQLGQLTMALGNLEREPILPPANLAQRTIAKVTRAREADSATIIRIPKAPPSARPAWNWATWRLADLVVAAGVMMVAGMVAFPAIRQAWVRQREVACQNNMRGLGVAMNDYASRHNNQYPQITSRGSSSAAGTYMVSLIEKGLLPDGHHPVCADPIPLAQPNRSDLERLYRNDLERFNRTVRAVGGSYGYSLGHINAQGQLEGPRRDQGDNHPLLADKGPRTVGTGAQGNSPNHGGRGQNVLFSGGNVSFQTNRKTPDGDDIYLNNHGLPRAGISSSDRVLGAGDDHP